MYTSRPHIFFIKVFFMQDKLDMPHDVGYVMLNDDMNAVGRAFFDKAYI